MESFDNGSEESGIECFVSFHVICNRNLIYNRVTLILKNCYHLQLTNWVGFCAV